MRVQKWIDDIQTNSQKPAIQIKFTTRANPTLLFTVNVKFDDDSCTQQIKANEKNDQRKKKKIILLFFFFELANSNRGLKKS